MTAPKSNRETDFTAHAKRSAVSELVAVAPSGGAENEDVPTRYRTREDLEKALNETKKSEAQLVESEARLRTIIDMVPSFLWTSLPDGSKEYLNKRWMTTRGYLWRKDRGGDGRSLFTRKTWTDWSGSGWLLWIRASRAS